MLQGKVFTCRSLLRVKGLTFEAKTDPEGICIQFAGGNFFYSHLTL